MLNTFLTDKEIIVKVGDRVAVQGYRGFVTEVIKTASSTNVRVHFDESEAIAVYNQYQDKIFGGFTVINEEVK